MREDICTIPISEVFEPKEGCPICRMRDTLENRVTEYITGAAMMEPDIREVTNVQGVLLPPIFSMMLKKGSRLSNALILESHLKEIENIRASPGQAGSTRKKEVEAAKKLTESCFVCEQIQWAMVRMFDTIYRLWGKEEEFRELFSQQPYLCLPHYTALLEGGAEGRRQEKLRRVCSGGQRFGEKLFGWPSKGRHPLLFYVRLPKYRRGFWEF